MQSGEKLLRRLSTSSSPKKLILAKRVESRTPMRIVARVLVMGAVLLLHMPETLGRTIRIQTARAEIVRGRILIIDLPGAILEVTGLVALDQPGVSLLLVYQKAGTRTYLRRGPHLCPKKRKMNSAPRGNVSAAKKLDICLETVPWRAQ